MPQDHGIASAKQDRFTTNSKQYLFVFEQIADLARSAPNKYGALRDMPWK